MHTDKDCACVICSQGPEVFHQRIQAAIDKFGNANIYVQSDDEECRPSFAYTIGLAASDLPELLLIGMEAKKGNAVLNRAAELMREYGYKFNNDEVIEIDGAEYKLIDAPDSVKDNYTSQASYLWGEGNYSVMIVIPLLRKGIQ